MKPPARILCIGHLDSGGASGIPQDTRTAAAHEAENSAVVTAVTWISPTGQTIFKVPPRVAAGQIDAAAKGAGACCVGMLPSPETVRTVMRRLQRRNVPNIVLRPVIFDDEGGRMLSASGAGRLCGYLSACAGVVATERNAWGVIAGGTLETGEGASAAARRLVELGAPLALVVWDTAGPAVSVYDGKEGFDLDAGVDACHVDELLAVAAACRLAAGEDGRAAFEEAVGWLTRGTEWLSLSS